MSLKFFYGSVLVAVFGVFVWLMAPLFWPSQIFIINDFTDISAKTLISLPEKPLKGQATINFDLDNMDYTNRNRLFTLYRYNPLTRKTPPLTALSGIPIIDARKLTGIKSNELLLYNPRIQQIIISEPDNLEKKQKILALFANAQDRQRINDFYHQSEVQTAFYKTRHLPKEETQFINDNQYEASVSCLVWHYFHHHEAMFGPINAYRLGKVNTDNVFFYGWLSNLMLYKVMITTGNFTFQHYLTLLNSVYPLYYFFWIALLGFLTRDLQFTLLAALLGIGSVYLTGFENIRFQPGLNPVRHYLDLPTIAVFSLFLYVKSRWRYGWLLVTISLATVAILNNVEFGLSLSAALIGALLVYYYAEAVKSKLVWLFIALTCVLTSVALIILPKTPYSLVKYFFLGVAVPEANFTIGIVMGLACFAVYGFLLLDKKNSLQSKMLILFSCFYFQACSLYYVIYAAVAHVRALFPLAVIILILVAKNVLTYVKSPVEIKNFWLALFIPSTVFYLISQFSFVANLWDYWAVKKTHQHYFWDFKNAQFTTDMDPKPFKNAQALIQKYEKNPNVYMISKYDSVLYWLSDHYSALPYGTLAIAMPTTHEQAIVVDKIKHATSCYLFVDTDIYSSHFGDVRVNNWDPLALKPVMNFRNYDIASVMIYYGLANLFDLVKGDYHLVEQGDLVTVYKANRCQV